MSNVTMNGIGSERQWKLGIGMFCLLLYCWNMIGCNPYMRFLSGNDRDLRGRPVDIRDESKAKLGDGCYHVFLDVGANLGVHSRFLMEPEKYPKAKVAKNHFQKIFGDPTTRDGRDFCIFAFEPNPMHTKRYEQFLSHYPAMGWRMRYFPVGVGDRAANLTFYHVDGGTNNEVGFTSVASKCNATASKECRKEVVPVIRLSDWIDEHVYGRAIPTTVYGSYERGPQVCK
jgi:FkbM family methyltransferase